MAQKDEGMNPIIKYLIFAIVGILTLILIISVSLFVFDSLLKFQAGNSKKQKNEETKKTKKIDKIKCAGVYSMKDELTISSDDGIVILKIDLAVSDAELLKLLPNYESLIKDTVNSAFITKSVEDIKKELSTKELNTEITKLLQNNLEKAGAMDKPKGWFSKAKKFKLINVYFTKFLVTKEG